MKANDKSHNEEYSCSIDGFMSASEKRTDQINKLSISIENGFHKFPFVCFSRNKD